MPIVESNQSQLVLVTGANGYIAAWIVNDLLDQGYRVRGAVRSDDKGKQLLETFKSHAAKDKLDFVVVEDITKEGGFDEAVVSVDAILHTASPVNVHTEEPDELIKPAVEGTLGILRSALKAGKSIKRIVMTSSCSTLHRMVTEPTTFQETDWADGFIEYVKTAGNKAPFIVKYLVSKTLAERAAWEFYEQHKGKIGWDFTTILPPTVFGRPLQEFRNPKDIPTSLGMLYKAIATNQPKEDVEAERPFGCIFVRDVSAAHVKALQKEAAARQRIIIASGSTSWQLLRNQLHEKHPHLSASGKLFRGYPEVSTVLLFYYNTEKSKDILEMTYQTVEEMAEDTLQYFNSSGWLAEGKFSSY